MNLIIKLHGTSGSGKTTVARTLMSDSQVTPILNQTNRKHEAYHCSHILLEQPLYVLGPYTATCGGLDSLNDVDEHMRLLSTYSQLGHVFYEGLLGSEYYGRIGKLSEQWGDRHIFAFLDTPIDVCIDRIKARRLAAGNDKPLNETNTRGRIPKIERLKYRLKHELHRQVIDVPHLYAAQFVQQLYIGAEKS
jgi:hypothetical protein